MQMKGDRISSRRRLEITPAMNLMTLTMNPLIPLVPMTQVAMMAEGWIVEDSIPGEEAIEDGPRSDPSTSHPASRPIHR